jgi:ankyrin repeat protein
VDSDADHCSRRYGEGAAIADGDAVPGCRAPRGGRLAETSRRLLPRIDNDVRAQNRRGAEPIHYAADGVAGGEHWNPQTQAETIAYLVAAGADPNAADGSKVRPLHRAVRTRCASAVRALLASGADPSLANGNGSTPLDLATRQTGRGGSGGPQAKAEQADIIRLLESPEAR